MVTCFYNREDRIYTVGVEHHDGSWCALRDCKTREEARAWISYLNGGDHPKLIVEGLRRERAEREDANKPKFKALS